MSSFYEPVSEVQVVSAWMEQQLQMTINPGKAKVEFNVAQSMDVIMAWESRGKNCYYYRTKRIAGIVRKEYIGRGPAARQAAIEDELTKRRRDREREQIRALQDAIQPVRLLTRALEDGERMLAHATLLAAGFHQNKGIWRKCCDSQE